MIGSNIAVSLEQGLEYSTPGNPGVPLEVILPAMFGVVLLVVCGSLIILVCVYINSRRKSDSLAMNEQIMELAVKG